MQSNPQIEHLDHAVNKFKKCIRDLPESKFLQPIHEWTPRDVLAHLIGWNRLYMIGLPEIKSGVEPSYFSDTYNDYRNVNAKSVEMFNQTNQGLLIDELENSFHDLKNYLISLDSDDWKTDFGVTYRGSTTTIAEEVAELIQDYDDHREEIQAWVKIQGVK